MSNCSWNSLLLLFPLYPDPDSLPPPLSSSSHPNALLASKKDLVSATLLDHETCSVSPLFLSADHTAIRIDAMEMAYSLQYLFSPAKTHPRNGLIHSNAKQALQHVPGRALSLKKVSTGNVIGHEIGWNTPECVFSAWFHCLIPFQLIFGLIVSTAVMPHQLCAGLLGPQVGSQDFSV